MKIIFINFQDYIQISLLFDISTKIMKFEKKLDSTAII